MRLLPATLFLAIASAAISSAQFTDAERKQAFDQPVTGAPTDEAAVALSDARTFRKKGEFANALASHEWFHANALRINPGYYGMRLSFALSDWMVLASQYPPALESLKRIRDEGTKTLEEGKGNVVLFHDVESINSKFSEEAASIGLFKKLDASHPELAKQCFRIISTTLIEKGELPLFDKYVGDPKAYLNREIQAYELGVKQLANDPRAKDGIAYFKQKLITVTLTLVKIANEKSDPALAAELKAMTDEVVPDPRLK